MENTEPVQKADSLQLARLKAASEDYKVHKSIFVDPVTEERLEGFLEWPVFRDAFLEDWKNNRRVVTEKEADMHFDRIADESLTELENLGSTADVAELAEKVAADTESETEPFIPEPGEVLTAVDAEPTPAPEAPAVVAPKRRGRPPGSGKKAKLEVVVSNDTPAEPAAEAAPKRKSYYVPVSQRKASKPAKASKPKVKAAAAKKKGKGTAERAAEIVAWGQSRKWARKDIIERMVARIDGLGAAYASSLYQKFAK